MKNKENIIGWVLIATLFIGFWFYQSKKLAEEQALKAEKEKTEQMSNTVTKIVIKGAREHNLKR